MIDLNGPRDGYVAYDEATGRVVREASARYLKNIRQAAGVRVVSRGWYLKRVWPRVCEEVY